MLNGSVGDKAAPLASQIAATLRDTTGHALQCCYYVLPERARNARAFASGRGYQDATARERRLWHRANRSPENRLAGHSLPHGTPAPRPSNRRHPSHAYATRSPTRAMTPGAIQGRLGIGRSPAPRSTTDAGAEPVQGFLAGLRLLLPPTWAGASARQVLGSWARPIGSVKQVAEHCAVRAVCNAARRGFYMDCRRAWAPVHNHAPGLLIL
jgi:hypothetical protein